MVKKGSDKSRVNGRVKLILYLLLLNVVLAGVMIYLDYTNGGLFHKTSDKGEFIIKNTYCNSDADCIPDNCCHASACVNKNNAPNCIGVLCTQVCAPGTLDCGQGSCSCIKNKCTAVLK